MDTINANSAEVIVGDDWYKRTDQLIQIAFIDESEPYETDQWGLYLDPVSAQVSLIQASGCSCWDGEYMEYRFPHLLDAVDALTGSEQVTAPSLYGALDLMRQTIAWLISQTATQQGGATCQQTSRSSSPPQDS